MYIYCKPRSRVSSPGPGLQCIPDRGLSGRMQTPLTCGIVAGDHSPQFSQLAKHASARLFSTWIPWLPISGTVYSLFLQRRDTVPLLICRTPTLSPLTCPVAVNLPHNYPLGCLVFQITFSFALIERSNKLSFFPLGKKRQNFSLTSSVQFRRLNCDIK